MNDPKVVPAGEVNLEGIVAQPDQLNDSGQPSGDPKTSLSLDYADNMMYLSERGAELLANGGILDQTLITRDIHPMISYTVSVIEELKGTDIVLQLGMNGCSTSLIKRTLESAYGPEIAVTGIYEATGLDVQERQNFSALVEYFPEFIPLAQMEGKKICLTNDPFWILFKVPFEGRGFLTGALRQKLGDASPIGTEKSRSWLRVLTFRDILEYAKRTGEVSRVKDYLDIYMGR